MSFAAPLTAEAALVQVSARANLGANDFIEWNILPHPANIPSPITIASWLGNSATVSNPRDFSIVAEGMGWSGNFASGDVLIVSDNGGGPTVIEFTTLVAGAGMQIQSRPLGAFTAQINVFGVSGTLLGSFTVNGISESTADNSAVFLGVRELNQTAIIKRIELSMVIPPDEVYAINRLDLVMASPVVVPTLSLRGTIIFMVFIVLGTIYFMGRRKRTERY